MVEGSAQKRYRAKNIVRCTFDLNRATDADLIAHLQSHPNRAAYLKELIRRDMEYTYEVVPLDEGDEGA